MIFERHDCMIFELLGVARSWGDHTEQQDGLHLFNRGYPVQLCQDSLGQSPHDQPCNQQSGFEDG